jgi:hypothetical protein
MLKALNRELMTSVAIHPLLIPAPPERWLVGGASNMHGRG